MNHDHLPKSLVRARLQTPTQFIQISLVQRRKIIHHEQKVVCNIKNQLQDEMFGGLSLHDTHVVFDLHRGVGASRIEQNQLCPLIHVDVFET